ncbi:hypothetical protein [Filomicrobium sp.]|uniref:hypothetical protein n=1 Tax=Filomicrobium sp. TaxID=2024831 RepID=UPI00258D8BE9|nr:hypothetical protein [Filomicrobium sp.]
MTSPFDRSVFINCPFDDDFAPLLQAMAFCVGYLGFFPRLAPENADNSAARLDRIIELIRGSKYGIHDLSRCKFSDTDQYARMNMPFELGLDHACRKFGTGGLADKVILVLEHAKYDYQKTLSDISGWDIKVHNGSFEKSMLHVRTWLVAHGAEKIGQSRIQGKYADFQGWYWKRELAAGSSENDIREYPTTEFIVAMHEWMDAGQPL